MEKSVPCGRFAMMGNSGLVLFYVTKFMQENVYYSKKHKAYLIAEEDGDEIFIHAVFSETPVEPSEAARAFGGGVRKIRLGFTPEHAEGYTMTEVKEEDTTLFLKGDGFQRWNEDRLMFPTLAHA